jgi:hypothetical protein
MSDGANSEPGLSSAPATEGAESEDQLGLSGENILALLQRAAGLADGNSRYAVEVAQNLSHQLGAADLTDILDQSDRDYWMSAC